MSKIYIVAAKRTPVGVAQGTLKTIPAPKLGAIAVKACLDEIKLDPKEVGEVIMGEIFVAGVGGGPGRQTSIYAGIPAEICGSSCNMLCASAMKAIIHGFNCIKAGYKDVVVCGGQESMSRCPYLIPADKARWGVKMGQWKVEDHMLYDGLTDVFNNYHMGVTAENVVKQYGITREEMDKFAYNSHIKAAKAQKEGKFAAEIVPVTVKTKKGEVVMSDDETINYAPDLEKMAKVPACFIPADKGGTITAATSSSINDGASAVILMSEEAVKKYNVKPLAELVGWGQGGVDPSVMGLGPIVACRDVFKNTGMNMKQIDLVELNEAFAAQSIACIRDIAKDNGLTYDELYAKTNVDGGAIALGHAVGNSGCRIVVTLIHALRRYNKEYGLASLCIGGGMGTAVIVRNCDFSK